MALKTLSRRGFIRFSAISGAGAILAACRQERSDFAARQTDTLRSLVILYTNDEHGWMEPAAQSGGAAGMLRHWQREVGYTSDGSFVALSGGDFLTGPALSTWFKGESMVDVMNAMGYAASAIGNHEFDFGLEALRQRSAQAHFPLLSANLREKATGKTPDFAQPYAIKDINGIRIGLVGLTTQSAGVDTKPQHVAQFEFLPYEACLREFVPQMKAAGVELMIVLGHICTGEARLLVPVASELGISILCAGHCHEETVEQAGNATIVQAGSFMGSYIRIGLLFDTLFGKVADIDARLVDNSPGVGDPTITRMVQSWHDRADPGLWQIIGYTREKIDSVSQEMARLLTIPWLEAFPEAQIALYNPRYIQSLPKGDISPAAILGMMPVDNELVDIQLTGIQVIETLQARQTVFGGLIEMEGIYLLEDGNPLELDAGYHVLIPDALYEGGNYYAVKQFDPNGAHTGVSWRTPVEEWVRRQNTSRQQPLDAQLKADSIGMDGHPLKIQ